MKRESEGHEENARKIRGKEPRRGKNVQRRARREEGEVSAPS